MRIRLTEAVASYNEGREKGDKMRNVQLAALIEYDNMKDSTLHYYLTHWDKGKYKCPIVVLKQIVEILDTTYEFLLDIEDNMVVHSLQDIVNFLIDYDRETTIEDITLIRDYLVLSA